MTTIALALKTLRDRWRASLAWMLVLVAMASIQLYIYPSIEKTSGAMDEFIAAFPPELVTIFRIDDYTSPTGFLGTELFSMLVPLIFIGIGASWGAAITADEEEHGTADILYSLPVPRAQLLLSKLVALVVVLVLVGAGTVVTIAIGAPMVDLSVETSAIVAVTLSCAMLGLFFAAVAFAIGAVTGRRAAAIGAAIGLALLSFVVYSLAPLVDTFDAIIEIIPFQWALGADPLENGVDGPGIGWLALASSALIAIGLAVFQRRDIRS